MSEDLEKELRIEIFCRSFDRSVNEEISNDLNKIADKILELIDKEPGILASPAHRAGSLAYTLAKILKQDPEYIGAFNKYLKEAMNDETEDEFDDEIDDELDDEEN